MSYTNKISTKLALLAFLLAGSVHANVKGTIETPSGWYPAGSTLTVTANPAVYRYVEWSGDTNGAAFAENEISFTVDGARQVDAEFKDYVTVDTHVPWWWLAEVFTNETFDTDGDFDSVASRVNSSGLSVAQAYWTGTDPIAEDARFEIASVTMAGGRVQLSWTHKHVAPDLPPIVIEGCASLANRDWVTVGTLQPTADGTINWQVPENSDYRFFRLRVNTR